MSKLKNIKTKIDLLTFNADEINIARNIKNEYLLNGHHDSWIRHNYSQIQFIPSILQWKIQSDILPNSDLKELNLNTNMNGLSLSLLDSNDINGYTGDMSFLKGYLPIYLSKDGEYNYIIHKDITFLDLVKDLASFGYKNLDNNNYRKDCLANNIMKQIEYLPIQLTNYELETIFFNDDLKSFKILEQDILNHPNWNAKNNFYILADKHSSKKIISYLLKNNYEFPIEDLQHYHLKYNFALHPEMENIVIEKAKNNQLNNYYKNYIEQIFKKNLSINQYGKSLELLKIYHSFVIKNNQEISPDFINIYLFKNNKKEVLPIYIDFFQQKNESVDEFLLNEQSKPHFELFKHKEIRDALSFTYLTEFFTRQDNNRLQPAHLENRLVKGSSMIYQPQDKKIKNLPKSKNIPGDFLLLKDMLSSYFFDNESYDLISKYRLK